MVLQKLSGRLSLQAFEALGRLPLADYRRGRLSKGDPAPVTSPKMVARWPTPGSRRQEDRLPRASHEARRLHKAGQDRTHQNYTHITVTRRGVATVRPTTPKPEAGMATGCRTGQPSPVRLGTVAMLASTSSTTDASTAHGRRAPLARERREGGPASPSRPRA